MRRMVLAALGAVFLCLCFPSIAEAVGQRICTPHAEIVDQLGKKYGETVSASGFDGAGNFVEIFSSDEGSWTIVVSIPGGPTCVIAAGTDWQEQDTPLPKADVPS